VPKGKTSFRDAINAALVEIQNSGTETTLLKKWSLDAGTLEARAEAKSNTSGLTC
jgi:ABC-type amino acid transport substrate-binding protein